MPYMETPPRVSTDAEESGEVPQLPGPVELLQQFHANAPPRSEDIAMDFKVVFHDERYAYKVTIQLCDHETGHIQKWAAPIPEVCVTYYTDGQLTKVEHLELEFVHNQAEYTAFFEDDLDFRWERFLFIGLEFGPGTIRYYNRTQEGEVEELMIQEMRKVSLLSSKTYANGPNQIWGRTYSGRGTYLES
jgi:hypothetical protein